MTYDYFQVLGHNLKIIRFLKIRLSIEIFAFQRVVLSV